MFFLEKLWKNKFRNAMFVLILIYPLIETLVFAKSFTTQGVYRPEECFFLRCNTVGYKHLFQVLLLWPLPMYLLTLFSSMYWNENKTGYRNAIISRIGKKKYIKKGLLLSFGGAFVLVMTSMCLNMLVSFLLFNGGRITRIEMEIINDSFLKWQILHPWMANLLFSFILAFVAGIVAMAGTACTIMSTNLKNVYGVIMAAWFVLLLKKDSIVLLFQPVSEYSIDTLGPIFVETVILFTTIGCAAYYKEIKSEK